MSQAEIPAVPDVDNDRSEPQASACVRGHVAEHMLTAQLVGELTYTFEDPTALERKAGRQSDWPVRPENRRRPSVTGLPFRRSRLSE